MSAAGGAPGRRAGWIALGANRGQPERTLACALEALGACPQLVALRCSAWLRTTPVDCPPGTPDFLNGVAAFETSAEPEWLLGLLHGIEARAGRDRSREGRHGARPLDLDLLCLGDLRRDRAGLTLPHPRFERRRFVLAPLCALDPDFRLPSGRTARAALAELEAAEGRLPEAR